MRSNILLWVTLLAIAYAPLVLSDEPVRVEIRGEPGAYKLYRDGKPYEVRGAGIDNGDLKTLKAYGGNSVRTWHAYGKILDQAHDLGLTVSLCLNVARERHGFDYNDKTAVAQQLANMREQVERFKDHPALLTWIIGNELNFDYDNPAVFDAVNDISRMIHEVDPYHPTTTAIAGLDERVLNDVRMRAADLDFLSVQVYGMLYDLPRLFDALNLEMPVMITEWGTIGHWEVEETEWGAPVEMNSSQKAAMYLQGFEKVIAPLTGKVIGSYVFLWGQKQERTPTWYGMFGPGGNVTEAVDVMHSLWRGRWPPNRAPKVGRLLLDGKDATRNVRLRPGQHYIAEARISDPDGDELTFEWRLLAESRTEKVGGDRERLPEDLTELIESVDGDKAQISAPGTAGPYRLYVYARDGRGAVAHANIPFLVVEN